MNNYINCRTLKDNVLIWYRDDNDIRQTKLYPGVFEFYTPHPAGKFTSIYGEKLIKHEFKSKWNMQSALEPFQHKNILAYESDINSELKLLANTFFGVDAPKLHYCMLDIEVDYDPRLGFSTIDNPYAPINAVALYLAWLDKSIVIAVPPQGWDSNNTLSDLAKDTNTEIILVNSEKKLLQLLLDSIEDSDCLSGWNSEMFDIPYIARRVEQVLGRGSLQKLCFPDAQPPSYEEVEKFGNKSTIVKLNGRIHWDYMELFKKFEMEGRPSYSLEAISNEILPDLAKLEYDGTLASLYNNDFEHFIRYNIRDTHVLRGFEQKLGYLELANDFYHSACGLPQHVFGTLRLADLSFVNYCHYTLDKKVPDWDQFKIDGTIHGAMVLTPQVGLHNMIGSVDINSLYPSAIRCINISAETLMGQMDGTYSNDDRKVHTAWKAIYEGSEERVTLVYNKFARGYTGSETHSAMDWKHILLERKWAISGSGTIFRQDEQGMIPAVLSEWFALRKKYKKLMEVAQQRYEDLSKIENPTTEQIVERDKAYQEFSFNHRRQYVYKIKLNSAYGALSNYRFRFFDLSLGQSTTGTGRAILEHMCSEIAKNLDGKYDMFSASIAYGDSVSADSLVDTSNGSMPIQQLFKNVEHTIGDKEYYHPTDIQTLTWDPITRTSCMRNIKYIMRHKCNKVMYQITTELGNYVDVTEDHSMIAIHPLTGELVEITPTSLTTDHWVLCRTEGVTHIGKVTSVHQLPKYDGYVYDIEVDDTHTFFANNILVHNTDSCYFTTNAEKLAENGLSNEQIENYAIKIADRVGQKVNESFDGFCERAFCVRPEFNGIMKCAREIVAKRGIFVTKKRYVLKLIDLDGYRTTKLKAMGLEMKKTTTPKHVQKFLADIMNMILNGEHTWDEIDDVIVEYRTQLMSSPNIMMLGLPKGIKKLEHYTELYKVDKKTRLPGHVAAAICYNECLKKYNDTENMPIVSGNKLKVFYILEKIGRFTSVAVPTDNADVPWWFVEHIALDYRKHEVRLIDNNLEKIFTAIGRQVPTKQTIFNNELLIW